MRKVIIVDLCPWIFIVVIAYGRCYKPWRWWWRWRFTLTRTAAILAPRPFSTRTHTRSTGRRWRWQWWATCRIRRQFSNTSSWWSSSWSLFLCSPRSSETWATSSRAWTPNERSSRRRWTASRDTWCFEKYTRTSSSESFGQIINSHKPCRIYQVAQIIRHQTKYNFSKTVWNFYALISSCIRGRSNYWIVTGSLPLTRYDISV